MKRSLLLCSACFTLALASAQKKEIAPVETQVIVSKKEAPPAPPAPPAVPVPDAEVSSIAAPPPPPPPPPLAPEAFNAPVPPVPPVPIEEPAEITINNTGYDISVRKIKGEDVVVVKQGKTTNIKMKTWLADRKYYESKYGYLPPPPPIIKKNS